MKKTDDFILLYKELEAELRNTDTAVIDYESKLSSEDSDYIILSPNVSLQKCIIKVGDTNVSDSMNLFPYLKRCVIL